ncbi:F-UL33 DNA cleavage/packaging protein [Chelonid alphaherpesvirus 5]|uniref:DNA cleavage/packaging protein n=2 Tax=Chelonid alphaherpesvirus 5 TaxID=702736 RepID=Q5ZR64_9ALPH|nr:DNA cleavage/packaging protein [Hawaiian green turtle herpesvirus]YP_010795548.1 F-UL33 DNA cleavage/packaging protein [Chelonid alphaherpesvirus 5]AAU93331.1 DNA cleavage/packaging protein [Hawaiian green turtle herpesvirus]AHA93362.1 F-UL33 DNA cleavage/packaging protein [Chelonid alphaherpesvirus 5]
MGEAELRKLEEVIPASDLERLSLDELYARYIVPPEKRYLIWFEDVTPPPLDVLYPTTDGKLNYLSVTQKAAAFARYREADCAHGTLVRRKAAAFREVLSKFLDLHRILERL